MILSTAHKHKSKQDMETIEEETKKLEQKKKSSLSAFDCLNDVVDAAFPNI